jgi:hypothetical protein
MHRTDEPSAGARSDRRGDRDETAITGGGDMRRIALAVVVATLGWAVVAVRADVTVLAVSGDASPDGKGTFANFAVPDINQSGEVAFYATLTGNTSTKGLFRGTGNPADLRAIIRDGAPSPDINGNFADFALPLINDAGQLVFAARLTGTFGGSSDAYGIFRGDGTPGMLAPIVRSGQAAPGGGTFSSIPYMSNALYLSFNNTGEVAFGAGTTASLGYFRGSGGAIEPIVLNEDVLDGVGTLSFSPTFAPLKFNQAGQLALKASADNIPSILRVDASTTTLIAQVGSPAPDGNGALSSFGDFQLSNTGDVEFFALLSNTSGGAIDNQGIFRFTATDGLLRTIARRGDVSPDGNGRFLLGVQSLGISPVAINDEGQAAFTTDLTGTAGGNTDALGLYRSDGTTLTTLLRLGALTPDGAARVHTLSPPALTNAGQVVVAANLVDLNGVAAGAGVFLFDDERGWVPVLHLGDALLGSTISAYAFTFTNRFTDQGKGAFAFSLADGRIGIAVVDPFTTSAASTPTPSPTPTATSSPTKVSTAGPSPTPTGLAPFVAAGTCQVPGAAGLVPCAAGTTVTVYACGTDLTCNPDTLTLLGSTSVGDDGTFLFVLDTALVRHRRLVFVATFGGGKARAAGGAAQNANQLQVIGLGPAGAGEHRDDVVIDPSAAAAAQLMAETGLQNYSNDAIAEITSAVRTATAGLSYAGLTPSAALMLAVDTARQDPSVQQVIEQTRAECAGDCDGSGVLAIDELVTLVNLALGSGPLSSCLIGDANHDGQIAINELVLAVGAALNKCGFVAQTASG